MMKLCFIGNSVSAQKNSYRDLLVAQIAKRDVEVSVVNCCLGGIGSLGIAFFIDLFAKGQAFDCVVLDTFVADLGGATPRHLIAPALGGLLQCTAVSQATVIPLFLYRSDIEEEQYQDVLDIYTQVLKNHGLSAINVYASVKSLVDDGQLDASTIVYDGVHTTPAGAALYAKIVMNEGGFENRLTQKRLPSVQSDAIIAKPLLPVTQFLVRGRFETGLYRLSLPYVCVQAGDDFDVEVSDGLCIGLIVVADADSGVISISCQEWVHQAQVYDRWCHQNRLQVVFFPKPVPSNQTIQIHAALEDWAECSANLGKNTTRKIGSNLKVVSLMLCASSSMGGSECPW
ncbi:SGNH_hydrolase domain containing protein [Burkholderiaceae bacterium]